MSWRDLTEGGPDISRLGRERLDHARVALLATLRPDGSPRISPIEPFIAEGELLFGAMTWSLKTKDLLRDSRCGFHSAVTAPDSGEGELKIYGRAQEADDRVRDGCEEGWWRARSPEVAKVFVLNIAQAIYISWDLESEQMTVRRWSPERGYAESQRRYP
jgi:hypothetical protein